MCFFHRQQHICHRYNGYSTCTSVSEVHVEYPLYRWQIWCSLCKGLYLFTVTFFCKFGMYVSIFAWGVSLVTLVTFVKLCILLNLLYLRYICVFCEKKVRATKYFSICRCLFSRGESISYTSIFLHILSATIKDFQTALEDSNFPFASSTFNLTFDIFKQYLGRWYLQKSSFADVCLRWSTTCQLN